MAMIRPLRRWGRSYVHFRPISSRAGWYNSLRVSPLWCGESKSLAVAVSVPNKNHVALTACSVTRYYHDDLSSGSIQTASSAGHDTTDKVQIGNVGVSMGKWPPDKPHLVPTGYLPEERRRTASMLRHLQWMMAKDNLAQDMLLIGPPGAGSLYRRRLALMYAEMTRREVEILTLSSDVTESDLKQRRELVRRDGKGAQVEFADQAPVRAAINGRLLILDGLEKAERNVLPTLNNLLENREMHLEDGRFLVSPQRFADLSGSGSSPAPFLLPTHADFRVIALGVPAPPFPGRSLDPPLRSRFQIRRVDNPSTEEFYADLTQSGAREMDAKVCAAFAGAMESAAGTFSGLRTLNFPINALVPMAMIMKYFPLEDHHNIFARAYPLAIKDERLNKIMGQRQEQSRKTFDRACRELEIIDDKKSSPYEILSVKRNEDDTHKAHVSFSAPSSSTDSINISVPCGGKELHQMSSIVQTMGTRTVLKSMIQEHAADRDILLLSPKGEGKTATAMEFASILGYDLQSFAMYKDMTSRDLLMRRTTSSTGETSWDESPLLKAARNGQVLLLDGVEKLSSDALGSLHSLMTDREIALPDGKRLTRNDRFEKNAKVFATAVRKVFPFSEGQLIPVHPSFRVVALASITKDAGSTWLSEEVMSMFSTVVIPPPSEDCMRAILKSVTDCPESILQKVLRFRSTLTEGTALDCGVAQLSTRNLIRIARRIPRTSTVETVDLNHIICSTLVADLLPPTQRATLAALLKQNDILTAKNFDRPTEPDGTISVSTDEVTIGDFTMSRGEIRRPEMVPSPDFFDIPSHVNAIKSLLSQWKTGERAFLLLGNQGVGKNKIVDRICQLARFEREYLQLHRDSTIGQLTLSPSLEDGKIVWKDSPLVRATTVGCALVIDEADKAPVEVISVLKSLVEDGELLLADGRRISRNDEGDGIIQMHPNFTLWVLANRPGYPFHGNDFFREVGDCFSTTVIPNPDLQSEINLLSSYAPRIESSVLRQIAASFADLRKLSEYGDLAYPYSTREAVAVVKHLQRYPDDDIVSTLHNVLDFDSFDDSKYSLIGEVFVRHGVPMSDYPSWSEALSRSQAKSTGELEIKYIDKRGSEGTSANPPPLSQPIRGKWDDNNEAHVGGNQWAGGTGGSNTAGLGGRGGPYRLDRGHKVHQVSDEAKAQVSEEAARAARQMARQALEERLKDINMSDSEWKAYSRFVEPIRKDIASLRGTLMSVESKRSERSWLKRQSHGEIDDTKLVDGVTGDKYIYKRRGDVADVTKPMQRPKRLRFVMDCSGSMYRFNGYDERLNRCLEAAVLIMESFEGMASQFDYSIVGHSGDSASIPLVAFGRPPQNEKERMRILQTMIAHSQYCQSGDNTLEAMEQAIVDVVGGSYDEHDADEYIVIGVSDANLARYGIHPRELGKVMEIGATREKYPVKAYCIFIASFGQEADDIKRSLPVGRGHVCMQTSDLPRVVRSILASQVE